LKHKFPSEIESVSNFEFTVKNLSNRQDRSSYFKFMSLFLKLPALVLFNI
jgi:hypothetical protein